MSIKKLKGAIFDLDGVVTQTAATHFKAWKETFDAFLKENENKNKDADYSEFSKKDYLTYVDGKPRYQGVMSFLDSRQIELEYGDESDPAEAETICGIGNKKNLKFRQLVDDEG
ncbi:MAG: hypothetical protein K9H13_11095, partial [Bacteroidales bacterium]|nr:hypothetical protein [Bacteroidales bacterium]